MPTGTIIVGDGVVLAGGTVVVVAGGNVHGDRFGVAESNFTQLGEMCIGVQPRVATYVDNHTDDRHRYESTSSRIAHHA